MMELLPGNYAHTVAVPFIQYPAQAAVALAIHGMRVSVCV